MLWISKLNVLVTKQQNLFKIHTMEERNKIYSYYFSATMKNPDYELVKQFLTEKCRLYLYELKDFKSSEQTIVNYLVATIRYTEPHNLGEAIIDTIQDVLFKNSWWKKNSQENYLISKTVSEANLNEFVNQIIENRHLFPSLCFIKNLNHRNDYSKDFKNKVYSFLKQSGVWKIKYEKNDPDGYFWQVEWDGKFFNILNLSLFANTLEEVDEIFKYTFFHSVGTIYKNEIHSDAKIIWENLNLWKKIVAKKRNEKVIVIHGFNSGPGEKATFIDEWLKLNVLHTNYEIISPQLSTSPKLAFQQLSDLIEAYKNEKVTVIGTSLGGFYALCLKAKFDSKKLSIHAINPAWLPSNYLQQFVGQEQINHKTNEKWIFSEQYFEEMKILEAFVVDNLKKCKNPKSMLHLAYNDEVLDFKELHNYIYENKNIDLGYVERNYHTNHRFEEMEDLVRNVFCDHF